MKTSDLTGTLLDYWTARAEGIPAEQLEIRATGTLCVRNMPALEGYAIGMVQVLNYSTNWALTGPLVEKHEIDLAYAVDPVRWEAEVQASAEGLRGWYTVTEDGDTPLIAICRAVVRAAFGDEVEDLP